MKPYILSKICFSRILEQLGKLDTGQKLLSVYLKTFLRTRIMLLFSSHLENLLAEGNCLYIIERGLVIVKLDNFSIRIEILSRP